MVKPDEKALMAAIFLKNDGEWPRDIATAQGVCYQRAYFLFHKWTRQGLYEWGVNAGLGWLTPEGEIQASVYGLMGN